MKGGGEDSTPPSPNLPVILIQPPVAKPCEPPAGLTKLSGALVAHGIRHTLLDANIEGLLFLLSRAMPLSQDRWSLRASRNLSRNLASLRGLPIYKNPDHYQRAVVDVNRLLEISARPIARLSLSDYEEMGFSAQKSEDLLEAAVHPERNIFYPYFSNRLPELIDKTGESGLVGISLSYLSQAICTFAIIGFLRQKFPRVRIVLGGSLVTSWMANPRWRNPFSGLVDFLVSGPGERVLLKLLGAQHDHRFCAPDFDRLSWSQYLSPGPVLPYAASAGCYWRKCSFCPENAEGTAFAPVPPGVAVDHIRQSPSRHRPSLVHLVDSALSPAMMRRMISEPPGPAWYGFSRITPDLADPDFCRGLKASGCAMLKLGLESGDQAVLDSLEKGITLELAARAMASLKRAGVATYVYLLFGTPQETPEAARRTLEYVAIHRDSIDFLNLAIFNLPVNCREAETIETRRFSEGDLSLYTDFVHPHGWSRKEVRIFLEREFRKHPAVRPILRALPRFFTSNHAPFFCFSE